MAENLLDSLMALVTPKVLSQAATTFGESEQSVTKGLNAAIPSVLAAFLNKTGDSGVMNQIFSLLSDPAIGRNGVSNVSGLLNTAKTNPGLAALGSQFLSSLFGNRQNAVENVLAETAGIKKSSATSLLGFVSPLVMTFLASLIRKGGLTVSGLTNLLKGQSSNISAAVPAGVSSVLGLSDLSKVQPTRLLEVEKPSSPNWLWPLLLAIGLIGALWWLIGRSHPAKAVENIDTSIPKVQVPAIQWP